MLDVTRRSQKLHQLHIVIDVVDYKKFITNLLNYLQMQNCRLASYIRSAKIS